MRFYETTHPLRIGSLRYARWIVLLVGAVLAVGAGSGASAISLSGSTLTLAIGALPGATVAQSPDPITVSASSGGGFAIPASAFATAEVIPADLFTGISLIRSLSVTFANSAGSMTPVGGPAGGFGGTMRISGQSIVHVLGGILEIVVPLGVVGAGGTTRVVAFALQMTVTGAPWTTGAVVVTGITTTTTTPLGARNIVNSATRTGFDSRTASGAGRLVLVSPVRILSNAIGHLPAFAVMALSFVPEPGTLLLLGLGAVSLAAAGRARRR